MSLRDTYENPLCVNRPGSHVGVIYWFQLCFETLKMTLNALILVSRFSDLSHL